MADETVKSVINTLVDVFNTNQRPMATIQKIVSVEEIFLLEGDEPAGNICQVRVLGWRLIAKKDEFKVGDLCIFFELDSILPDGAEWSEFMRSRKFRVKTLKYSKFYAKTDVNGVVQNLPVVSQGLALPLSTLMNPDILKYITIESAVGLDVTPLLGVTKYEPALKFVTGDAKGDFPTFIPKTDETRIQSRPGYLELFKGKPYFATVKLDGTSCTVYSGDDNALEVASRNMRVKESEGSVYWRAVRGTPGIAELLAAHDNYVVQGEVCGPSIQKNLLGLNGLQFFAFNIYDIVNACYVSYSEFKRLCEKYNVQTVPIEMMDDNFDFTLEQIEAAVKGVYVGTNNSREGLVFRLQNEEPTKLGRASFKCINVEYLLKE